jgi:hypothetical protein
VLVIHRSAYNESLLLGQALTKKLGEDPAEKARREDDEEEFDVSSSAKFARAVSSTLEAEGDADDVAAAAGGRYGKLLNMDFMKQAATKQKQQALLEAQSVLRELREMESTEADSESEGRANIPYKNSAEIFSLTRNSTPEDLASAKSNVDKLLSRGGSTFALLGQSFESTGTATKLAVHENAPGGKKVKRGGGWNAAVVDGDSSEINPWLVSADDATASFSRNDKKVSSAVKELEKTVFLKPGNNTGKDSEQQHSSTTNKRKASDSLSSTMVNSASVLGASKHETGADPRKSLTQQKTQVLVTLRLILCHPLMCLRPSAE